MFSTLETLNCLINQYSYTVLNDTPEKLKLSFIYNNSLPEDIFIDTIKSILELSQDSIKLESSNTMPSLSSQLTKHKFPDYIKKHFDILRGQHTAKIEYVITINKNELIASSFDKNVTWFLNVSAFEKLLSNPFNDSSTQYLSNMYSQEKTNIILFLVDQHIFVKNNNTLIISIHNNATIISDFSTCDNNLKEKSDLRKSCCSIELDLVNIVPDFFIFDFNNSMFLCPDTLKILLNNLFVLFMILYLGNYSFLDNKTVHTKISANKSINFDLDLDDLTISQNNYTSLIELYYLSYNSINIQNIYLVRNMLTVYLCEDCNNNFYNLLFKKAHLVLDSAKENLNIITIGDVEKYFSIRYSIYDFLDKSTEYLQSRITELTEKMNKTYLSTIATLVGVSFIYLKDRNITILRLSILIYTLFLLIDGLYSFTSQYKAFSTFDERYENKLSYFKPILGTEHYKKITDNESITEKLKKRFKRYFYISVFLYSLMFIVGILAFIKTNCILNLIKKFIAF